MTVFHYVPIVQLHFAECIDDDNTHLGISNNWRASSKKGVCTYFVSDLQFARNPLADPFCVKKCPCFFHKRANKKHVGENPPSSSPPTPPPIASSTHAQCFGSQGSKSYVFWIRTEKEEGGGGGGGGGGFGGRVFRAILCIFSCLLEKKTRTFFNTKRVGMPNLIVFRANWKIAAKYAYGALQLS